MPGWKWLGWCNNYMIQIAQWKSQPIRSLQSLFQISLVLMLMYGRQLKNMWPNMIPIHCLYSQNLKQSLTSLWGQLYCKGVSITALFPKWVMSTLKFSETGDVLWHTLLLNCMVSCKYKPSYNLYFSSQMFITSTGYVKYYNRLC